MSAPAAPSPADLALAKACDGGSQDAWRTLHREYAPRLVGLLRRREGARIDADAQVDELFSELALPPARGATRTRLGSYDGRGSLFAWLAASLVHRLARAVRDRLRTGLSAEHLPPAEPSAPLLDAEDAAALDVAVASAWARLEPEERAVVVWKYRHGLAQRRLAELLGVGEERVSRWVQRGVAKLRGAVEALSASHDPAGSPARDHALLFALERRLASLELETALPRIAPEPA